MTSLIDNKEVTNILKDPFNYANNLSILNLVKLLKKLNKIYRQTNKGVVSDEIYDIIKDVLEKKDPDNSFLKQIGAPISKDKVPLPYLMGSLDKIKSDSKETSKWKKKYKGPYVLSDKLDGVSGLLVKKNKKLKLYTRGDGTNGQDISYLIPYVINKSVDLKSLPNDWAGRGELIISKKDFEKVKNDYSNARNAVAGLVNSKNYSKKLAKLTNFVLYSVVNPLYKQEQQMKNLKKKKFDVVNNTTKNDINNELLGKMLVKRRKEGSYEIDGIVVIDSSKEYKNKAGNPKHGFAYKTILTDQIAEVKVLDVIWDVSMDGYIKPRLLVEEVRLVGVDINYVTAFNAKYVKDNKLAPGAVIKLVRSGDVIPHILEVIKESPTGKPKMPDYKYKWNKTKVDIIVSNMDGELMNNIKVKLFNNFFEKLKVKNISVGILKKLIDNGYNTLPKILNSELDDLIEIDNIGEKLVKKIKKNINDAFKKMDLVTFMAASHKFGRGFGVRKLKLIIDKYPDILDKKWNKETMVEKINEIEGYDDTTSIQFASNLKEFKKFYNEINNCKNINISHILKVKKKKIGTLFKDKKIVFTGFRDKTLEEFINNNGGSVKTTVSGNTNLVVYVSKDNKKSSKLEKAKKLNLELITKENFEKKYYK